jgi:hypothetical protein
MIKAQKQRDSFKAENSKLTLDIGILSKDVIKKRHAPDQVLKIDSNIPISVP